MGSRTVYYVIESKGVVVYTVTDGLISPESDDIMGQIMLALRYAICTEKQC